MRGHLWFKRKRYGWGWTPANGAGWVAVLLYSLGSLAYPLLAEQGWVHFSLPLFLGITLGLTIGFIALCFAKGEKPRWQWGDDR